MTPPIGSREDCKALNLSAAVITAFIPCSLKVNPSSGFTASFIPSKNVFASDTNFSIEDSPLSKLLNKSVIPVRIEVPPISAITSINCLTPSKDSPFIPDADRLAIRICNINAFISAPILTKLSPKPSPIPPMNLPIIVPMLPASCSRTGSPVSRNC